MQLYQHILRELVLSTRMFEMQLNDILQQHHIHRSDWSVMYYLIHDEDISSVEIARKLAIEKPNVTRTIKKLVQIGYCTVENSVADKRKKRLIVTPKGYELYNNIYKHVQVFEQEILQGISKEHQVVFLQTLQQIHINLEQRAGKCK